ncbi:MAG TPA: HAD family phosphatase [Terriglobia bacterium]|nr:HAD family phosphatase [Terriglobia bacterium]
MPIECVLFDLGKVLIDFDFERGLNTFATRSGCSREQRGRLERALADEGWKARYESGLISTADYHRYLCDAGGVTMDLDEFRFCWSSIFLPGLLVSEDLLTRLKRRYPLILVSNTNEVHLDFVAERYDVLRYFDQTICSHEVGAMKPDPRIYEAAIAAAGKPPEALFFTDDREENVDGATRMGIHARRFVSESALIQDLRDLGVEL